MRLWHKVLISALPREQLVAQWRELSSIAGNIINKGTPNHILVNRIMDYSFDHFISYALMIRKEMTNRGYHTMDKVWNKITSVCNNDYKILPLDAIYSEWMDSIYLDICYYNLLEKHICGGVNQNDWEKIAEARRIFSEE